VFVTRTRAEEYRCLAQECLAAARSTSTEEVRALLTEQAAHWFRLAEQQERAAGIEGSTPPTPTQDQPAAQQQQQVQPKDDDKDKNKNKKE
jgi:hypothetical protein